jgi:SAM-dependent methyltransferase
LSHLCPICRAQARVPLHANTRSGDVHRCIACGFVYSDPRGPERPTDPPAVTDDPAAYLANARHRLGLLAKATGVTGGRLLDVGCYDGAFLLAANELGFAGQGVEPSPVGAAAARARGLEVTLGAFEDATFAEPFDVVTFVHSLEHFEDPLTALEQARAMLAPGGALLVEVPNFAALSRRVLGRRWRQFITDHFHFFEPATLRRCLDQAGFTTALLEPVGKLATYRLLSDRLGRYYSAPLGRTALALAKRTHRADRLVHLNLGDILLAVATPRPGD